MSSRSINRPHGRIDGNQSLESDELSNVNRTFAPEHPVLFWRPKHLRFYGNASLDKLENAGADPGERCRIGCTRGRHSRETEDRPGQCVRSFLGIIRNAR